MISTIEKITVINIIINIVIIINIKYTCHDTIMQKNMSEVSLVECGTFLLFMVKMKCDVYCGRIKMTKCDSLVIEYINGIN